MKGTTDICSQAEGSRFVQFCLGLPSGSPLIDALKQ